MHQLVQFAAIAAFGVLGWCWGVPAEIAGATSLALVSIIVFAPPAPDVSDIESAPLEIDPDPADHFPAPDSGQRV